MVWLRAGRTFLPMKTFQDGFWILAAFVASHAVLLGFVGLAVH